MKLYFITIAYNKCNKAYYENLVLECSDTDIKMYNDPAKNMNVFTQFVYQKALKINKDITPEQSIIDYPIVNIFQCM